MQNIPILSDMEDDSRETDVSACGERSTSTKRKQLPAKSTAGKKLNPIARTLERLLWQRTFLHTITKHLEMSRDLHVLHCGI